MFFSIISNMNYYSPLFIDKLNTYLLYKIITKYHILFLNKSIEQTVL